MHGFKQTSHKLECDLLHGTLWWSRRENFYIWVLATRKTKWNKERVLEELLDINITNIARKRAVHCHQILRTHRLTNRLCRAHKEDQLLEKHASSCARTAVRRCVVYLMFGDSAMKVQLAVGHIFKRLVMSGRELVLFHISTRCYCVFASSLYALTDRMHDDQRP